jgi:hypothetical protein
LASSGASPEFGDLRHQMTKASVAVFRDEVRA